MPPRKKPLSPAEQSARFREAARATGADQHSRAFERAFKKIVPVKKRKKGLA